MYISNLVLGFPRQIYLFKDSFHFHIEQKSKSKKNFSGKRCLSGNSIKWVDIKDFCPNKDFPSPNRGIRLESHQFLHITKTNL
jgi:hypothetical protein